MFFVYFWIALQLITESLPISSSGHLVLFERLYAFLYSTSVTCAFPFASMQEKVLISHLLYIPTLIILAGYFFNEWFFLVRNCVRVRKILIKICFLALVAASITATLYFTVKPQQWTWFPPALGFGITALFLFSTLWVDNGTNRWNLRSAIILGFVQAVALLPGISRLGSVYCCARWLGIPVRRALQISFLIQVPLIGGALLLACLELAKGDSLKILNLPVALVIIISTALAWYALQITVGLAYKNRWWYFALYLLIPLSIMTFLRFFS